MGGRGIAGGTHTRFSSAWCNIEEVVGCGGRLSNGLYMTGLIVRDRIVDADCFKSGEAIDDVVGLCAYDNVRRVVAIAAKKELSVGRPF